jgi:hypothetical protein
LTPGLALERPSSHHESPRIHHQKTTFYHPIFAKIPRKTPQISEKPSRKKNPSSDFPVTNPPVPALT